MCLLTILKLLKFLLPVAIIGVVVYFVFFHKPPSDANIIEEILKLI